jgi:hypothetical protein
MQIAASNERYVVAATRSSAHAANQHFREVLMIAYARSLHTSVVMALVIVGSACAVSRPPEQQAASFSPWCEDGRPTLIVRNDSDVDIEIVEGRNILIALLPVGYHEVQIRGDRITNHFARPVGQRRSLSSSWRPRPGASVTLTRECRKDDDASKR